MTKILRSITGRQFGLGPANQLISNEIEISRPCVNATVTVSAEGATTANQRDITIQLLDSKGNDIDYAETVVAHVFLDGAGLNWAATGGSTGIAVGTDGDLEALVAKKIFMCRSEADGDLDLTWTDIGTETAYLGIQLPNGRIVFGDQALTNA